MGVLIQCKQTAENTLRPNTVRRELSQAQIPDATKPWKYLLFTNAKDTRTLGELVDVGARAAGFRSTMITSRSNLISFFSDRTNYDLTPRFFPHHGVIQSDESMRRALRQPEREHATLFGDLLPSYFPDNWGHLIVRDLEYEDSYPHLVHDYLEPSEFLKICLCGFDDKGLLYKASVDGRVRRVPYDAMVLWNPWEDDKIENLPHLYVAGLDRIELVEK
jgi:hypothetical protein